MNATPSRRARVIRPNRREAIFAGGTAFGSLVAGPDFSRAAECILTSRQIDGPYHISGSEERSDVRSGKPGVDLLLRLKVVDAATCEPIAGVGTEIWSCDALGNYSGHPDVDPNVPPGGPRGPRSGDGPPPRGPGGRRSVPIERRRGGGPPAGIPAGGGMGRRREPTGPKRFLRGSQAANDRGEVEYLTIFPGWYAPRAVHVHVKVHFGGDELLTTQLYFPDELTDSIHQTGPYVERYPSPYRNSDDRVKFWGVGGDPVGVYPTMSTEGKMQVGTLTIGVKSS